MDFGCARSLFYLDSSSHWLEHGLHQNLPIGTDPNKVPSRFKFLFDKHCHQPSPWFARTIPKPLPDFIATCLQPFTTSHSLQKHQPSYFPFTHKFPMVQCWLGVGGLQATAWTPTQQIVLLLLSLEWKSSQVGLMLCHQFMHHACIVCSFVWWTNY